MSSELTLNKKLQHFFNIRKSAQAHFVLEQGLSLSRVLVVTESENHAESLFSDLEQMKSLFPSLKHQIFLFPEQPGGPYSSLQADERLRFERLKCLYAAASNEPIIVVSSFLAAHQLCPTPKFFSLSSLTLKPSDFVPIHEIAGALHRLGYSKTDLVEEPGQFATRGHVCDFFPVHKTEPIRLEFFGDELESIKTFNPVTQRTENTLSVAIVTPAKEWVDPSQDSELILSAIKKTCDDLDVSKKDRDLFINSIETFPKRFFSESLFPFIQEDKTNLFYYFEKDPVFFVAVAADVAPLKAEITADFESFKQNHAVALPPRFHYLFDSHNENIFHVSSTQGTDNNSDYDYVLSSKDSLDSLLSLNYKIFCFSPSALRRDKLLENFRKNKIDKTVITILENEIESGFIHHPSKTCYFSDTDFIGKVTSKYSPKKFKTVAPTLRQLLGSIDDLTDGQLVVHELHGLGVYKGIHNLTVEGVLQEFISVEYREAHKLYLPPHQLDKLQRYIGDPNTVTLDVLGGESFQKTKSKVKESIEAFAHDLLKIYAERSRAKSFIFSPPDDLFKDFENKFPYIETPDQLRAIEQTINDMCTGKTMDRIICGDVGFGKTEVAARAAFKAVLDKKQVAVLTPTTLLCFQHEKTFKDRFTTLPIRVESLSRLKNRSETEKILADLKNGKIDIIIGTHKILSESVVFNDLGLLIIDEEHKFGVSHKEKIKSIKADIPALTLTATPIPRTLQMSLFGLRDISLITTPPADRKSIQTFSSFYDEGTIKKAIETELARKGQVYLIHNSVEHIYETAELIERLCPKAKIVVAHGQTHESLLEDKMMGFFEGKYNVLISTTIIESGLDVPNANTLIVLNCDRFGLSQLYQLRGRIGRSHQQAFCYLLLPKGGKISDDAQKRIDIICKHTELGSGFRIASHDLELRGGGDILGKAQSGHIASVGLELYSQLLEEAISELQGNKTRKTADSEIKFPTSTFIPPQYIPSSQLRLKLYKSLASCHNEEEVDVIASDIADRFGAIPQEVTDLVWLLKTKCLLVQKNIKSLVSGKERYTLSIGADSLVDVSKLLRLSQKDPSLYSITPDSRLVVAHKFMSGEVLFTNLKNLLSSIALNETRC